MEDSSKAAMVNYNDDSIRTMEGLKHIRLRPGMYIGALGDGTDPRDGIYTILKEVLDNSVDEFTTGFGKNIIVDVNEKTATVRDFGQGIPLGSVIKAVSTLNTSGRFDDSVYQKTIGLNGVGLKATNALSIDFYVASYRDGECSWAKFSRGELLDSGREASEEKNGVLIRFTPDEAMFPYYAYKMEHLEQMVRNYTCVKVGLTMTFNGRPYRSENGLPDWIAYNIPQMPLYEPIHLEGKDIELVLTHYDGSGTILGSFVNGQFTIDGGTHLSAFKEAVARALMDFYKKDYSADDCRQGLVGAIYIHMQDPLFSSQQKIALYSEKISRKDGEDGPTVRSFINDFVSRNLGNYLLMHKDVSALIEKKIKQAYKLRQEINDIKNRNKISKAASVYNENLRDCRVHYGSRASKELAQYIDQTSIFITEGKSASGTVTKVRNPICQAVFSIRGKSKNSYRSSEAKVLENVELRNLVAALGLTDGLDGLRYNRVIVASDADDDGMHIRMLLVTFFLKYYIDLIKAGHLYILETPLFRVKTKKRNHYCYSQEERDAAVAEFGKEKVEITRFKGLGEINEGEFRDFIGKDMRLVPITIDEAEDVQMLLSFYMGVNTFERQKFIMKNLRSQTEIEGIDEDETWLN
ncbi:MAG: toprim domain-containing protein [Bacteroidales bacterium]|nr:toprim domain-containing protein [Bacteroidales bacterium]